MEVIHLPRGIWKYDPSQRLGEAGGFGEVFLGKDEEGKKEVAIKRLFISSDEADHRELAIADDLCNKEFDHVMPIIDAGQDSDTSQYYIVMPVAKKNLSQEIFERERFSDLDTIDIMIQITNGLEEVSHIVHRDLKPANVLFHDGNWKIADFGIARFVENSTSPRTLKDCLTKAYAAPEQWKFERATNATDIYALGCIGFELLVGSPPFLGPDFKKQHTEESPQPINSDNPKLISLISMMLRKPSGGRPTRGRIITILNDMRDSPSHNKNAKGNILAHAGAKAAEEKMKEEVERSRVEAENKKRSDLVKLGIAGFHETMDFLCSEISKEAPIAEIEKNSLMRKIKLGKAYIHAYLLQDGKLINKDYFQKSGWDVIIGAYIYVSQYYPQYQRGANIWYTNMGVGDEYRLWEVCYMHHPLRGRSPENQPYGFDLVEYADIPLLGMHTVQFASKPKPVDDENIRDFTNRWSELLALAFEGKLSRPRTLPID
ncbi:MAG: serine/threonine-protein kinase [Anaerolineales bacterium]|jgi:serine/threonine-protein kinase